MTYGDLKGMHLREPITMSLSSWLRASASGRNTIRQNFKRARDHIEKERDYNRRKAAGKLKPKEAAPRASGTVAKYVQLLKGEIIGRSR